MLRSNFNCKFFFHISAQNHDHLFTNITESFTFSILIRWFWLNDLNQFKTYTQKWEKTLNWRTQTTCWHIVYSPHIFISRRLGERRWEKRYEIPIQMTYACFHIQLQWLIEPNLTPIHRNMILTAPMPIMHTFLVNNSAIITSQNDQLQIMTQIYTKLLQQFQ